MLEKSSIREGIMRNCVTKSYRLVTYRSRKPHLKFSRICDIQVERDLSHNMLMIR